MLGFPNCKINLGLHVVSKRSDGFHNIETVFYPVNWCDALEIIEHKDSEEAFVYSHSGIPIGTATEQNLLYKAWKIVSEEKKLPPIKVHLHKTIPMGAGLGGGSSDAAHFIDLISKKFDLDYSEAQKIKLASLLGSDCAFFIKNRPAFATGKGDQFSNVEIDLNTYYILVVYPNIHSDTKEAYQGLTPQKPRQDLISVLNKNIYEWKNHLVNDFETSILKKYPAIKLLKEHLYEAGAAYSSMSGSGSAVFGIFEKEPVIRFPENYLFHLQKPSEKIL